MPGCMSLVVISAIIARTLLSDHSSSYHDIQRRSVAVANCIESSPEIIPADGKLHTLDVTRPIQLPTSWHIVVIHDWQLYR